MTLRAVFATAMAAVMLVFATVAGSAANSRPSATSPGSLAWALPRSAVGEQFEWLAASAAHLPISASTAREHFDTRFLDAVSAKALDRAIQSVKANGLWRIVTLDASTSPDLLIANVVCRGVRIGVEIGVDKSGRIGLLYFQPAPAIPTKPPTWIAVDHEANSLAPDVGFAAATISRDGRCDMRDAESPDEQRPLGSMFKLFVLGAVANAVKTGRITWSQSVALNGSERSLPSGLLQVDPVGTRFTVAELAQQMIASSDNTAADMLMALVGRPAVESQVARVMPRATADTPFLTPREFFILKYDDFPQTANDYLSLNRDARLSYLDRVIDKVPLTRISPSGSALTSPRDIDSIEWFASPSAICSAFAGLYSFSRLDGFAPVGAALSLNDGGIALPSADWHTVWFKGGSEAGVLTLGYLAVGPNADPAVVVLELSDAASALSAGTALHALAVIRGAFSLLSFGDRKGA